MLFTIGTMFMLLGWALAWFFGGISRFEYDWCDKVGTGMFSIGLGLTMASTVIFAFKYMP